MRDVRPRVTIGLPVHNGEKYIEQALDSILAQTFVDFDLIVSDDASTDRTQEICQAYCAMDPRIRYHRNENSLGVSPNFNRAFDLSSSEYFKWAAYDEVIAPEFLSRCVEVLDRNSAVVNCFPRCSIIDENSNLLGEHDYAWNASSPKPHVRFRDILLIPDQCFQFFGLMRASVLRKTTRFGRYPGSDSALLAELALRGPFYEIPEYLFFPRYHSEQIWITFPVERDRVRVFDTSLEGKIVLPKWNYPYGYLNVIRRAPISNFERAYCLAMVVRWILRPDHFRAMGKDVLLAVRQALIRAFSKPDTKAHQTA